MNDKQELSEEMENFKMNGIVNYIKNNKVLAGIAGTVITAIIAFLSGVVTPDDIGITGNNNTSEQTTTSTATTHVEGDITATEGSTVKKLDVKVDGDTGAISQ